MLPTMRNPRSGVLELASGWKTTPHSRLFAPASVAPGSGLNSFPEYGASGRCVVAGTRLIRLPPHTKTGLRDCHGFSEFFPRG